MVATRSASPGAELRSPGAYVRSSRSTAQAKANQAAVLSRHTAAEAAKKGKAAVSKKPVNDKKQSVWATYQTLLVRYPFTMNIAQSGVITAAGIPANCKHLPDPKAAFRSAEV